MTLFSFRTLRQLLGLLLLCGLLSVTCHPYRIPNPTGPPQPKVHKARKADKATETAAGTSDPTTTEAKPMKNSYDKKTGLMKKPKYKQRRLKTKVGQRSFLGIPLPF